MSKGENYEKFVEKFKRKKTTDDCMTPELVYKAVLDFVTEKYGVDRSSVIRPFWPGGDYQSEDYTGKTVVDNPPFSILSRILRFYLRRGTAFFLFAPALTLFGGAGADCCAIPVGVTVTYENGAEVPTSFLTSLEPGWRVRTAPDLFKAIELADKEGNPPANLPRYTYPDNILTAAMAQRWCKYGVEYRLAVADSLPISSLDAQRAQGKSIFGSGYILGTRAAATIWPLSETEAQIVDYIDRRSM